MSADRIGLRRRPAARALRLAALLSVLLAGLGAPGCERNVPETLLVPTGVRPPLADPPGSVTGYLYWAPLRFPDLANPPYPPTVVELGANGTVVARDTTGVMRRDFRFEAVQPGTYTVTARARGFLTTSATGIKVLERPVDAGDLSLPLDPAAYSFFMGIIGTLPGFDYDSYFGNLMDQPSTGIFTTVIPADVPAGTYRFKFATTWGDPLNTEGWGGDSTVVLQAPVSQAPAVFGSGPARDIKVTFTAAGQYQFQIDERRQTFSITPATVPAAVATRRPR